MALREEVADFLRSGAFRCVDTSEALSFYESQTLPHVAVVEGGPGRLRAQETTVAALDRYHPRMIISAGFGGGTISSLKPGDLVIGETVLSLRGPSSDWKKDSAAIKKMFSQKEHRELEQVAASLKHPAVFGNIATVDRLVTSSQSKAWLGQTLSASVVDLESYWVTDIAVGRSTRCIALRSVLDPMEQELPAFVAFATEDASQRSWWRAALYALRRPGDVPTLLSLSSQYRAAKASLSAALHSFASSQMLEPLSTTRVG
ncbi:MAG: hypothetical protein O2854_07810 [Chloroflexi bacterium]|nr:hypothetical protein [Chloroflexota bacterium]